MSFSRETCQQQTKQGASAPIPVERRSIATIKPTKNQAKAKKIKQTMPDHHCVRIRLLINQGFANYRDNPHAEVFTGAVEEAKKLAAKHGMRSIVVHVSPSSRAGQAFKALCEDKVHLQNGRHVTCMLVESCNLLPPAPEERLRLVLTVTPRDELA